MNRSASPHALTQISAGKIKDHLFSDIFHKVEIAAETRGDDWDSFPGECQDSQGRSFALWRFGDEDKSNYISASLD